MPDRAQNLQDTFLNHVRKNKTPLTIFLVNGVKLQGIVTWFDNFCVLLRRDGHSQLVYKHAISTIMPGTPLQLFEPQEEGAGREADEGKRLPHGLHPFLPGPELVADLREPPPRLDRCRRAARGLFHVLHCRRPSSRGVLELREDHEVVDVVGKEREPARGAALGLGEVALLAGGGDRQVVVAAEVRNQRPGAKFDDRQ